MKKITRKGIIRALDKIVSQIVRARDKSCIQCGTTLSLTCGHLFSRVAYSTRWDLSNCYAQCLSHNLAHEYDPYPMTKAVKNKWKEIIDVVADKNRDRIVDEQMEELHLKYVTPHKYKDFELLEMLEQFKKHEH